jgi:hypothetical protein
MAGLVQMNAKRTKWMRGSAISATLYRKDGNWSGSAAHLDRLVQKTNDVPDPSGHSYPVAENSCGSVKQLAQ